MNRIITLALAGILLLLAAAPPPSSARTEWRNYALGVGALEMPTCEDENSLVSLFSVCYRLPGGDSTIRFEIKEDVTIRPVLGSVTFYDDVDGALGTPTLFCGASSTLAIPAGADEVRVVLGSVPAVFEAMALSCLPGVGTRGVVEAVIT